MTLPVLLVVLWCACAPTNVHGQHKGNELKVKTAYVFKFTRYFSWPKSALQGKKVFLVTVYGKGLIGDYLSLLAKKGLKAHGLPIHVRRIKDWKDYQDSHIVVVPSGNSRAMPKQVIRQLRGKPVLIVVNSKGLARAGACINFFLDPNDGTVGFELNIDAVKRAGLGVRASLLKVADVIKDKR